MATIKVYDQLYRNNDQQNTPSIDDLEAQMAADERARTESGPIADQVVRVLRQGRITRMLDRFTKERAKW